MQTDFHTIVSFPLYFEAIANIAETFGLLFIFVWRLKGLLLLASSGNSHKFIIINDVVLWPQNLFVFVRSHFKASSWMIWQTRTSGKSKSRPRGWWVGEKLFFEEFLSQCFSTRGTYFWVAETWHIVCHQIQFCI